MNLSQVYVAIPLRLSRDFFLNHHMNGHTHLSISLLSIPTFLLYFPETHKHTFCHNCMLNISVITCQRSPDSFCLDQASFFGNRLKQHSLPSSVQDWIFLPSCCTVGLLNFPAQTSLSGWTQLRVSELFLLSFLLRSH